MQAESPSKDPEDLDEIARRRDEIVRRMANTPPQPKPKAKPGASPKKRGRPAKEQKSSS